MERTAECHCGSLRAIVSGDPEWVDLCHCKACQRRTGTAFHFGATYLKDRVRLEGERKIYQRDGDSGYRIRFHFCPKCGSNVYWEGDSNTAVCGITVGSFADPNFPLRTYSQWEAAKHDWIGVLDRYRALSPGPAPSNVTTARQEISCISCGYMSPTDRECRISRSPPSSRDCQPRPVKVVHARGVDLGCSSSDTPARILERTCRSKDADYLWGSL